MENENIYQPPDSQLAQEEQVESIEDLKASKGLRFFTYILDLVFVYALSFVIGMLMYILMGDIAAEDFLNTVPQLLFGYFIMLVYYWPQEAFTGRTLAKLILGTKVVDEQGKKPGPGKALGRTLCRMIPFEPFSFLGESGRGWHDSIPSTYVIKTR